MHSSDLDAIVDCAADKCRNIAEPEAPVPLCRRHLLLAFAHVMLTMEDVSGGVAEHQPRVENPVDYSLPVTPLRPSPNGTTQGFVYFIRFADRIKIGWSGNPQARFKNLPHDELLHLEPGTMLDERNLHAMFAEHRVVGEWFNDVPEIRTFISQRSVASA